MFLFFNLGIILLILPIPFLRSSLKYTICLLKYLKIIYNLLYFCFFMGKANVSGNEHAL